MKKSILPPENWQDFETLCKKLFGEIWGCSNTIKKNGRLGQSQSGVDIFGKPKGENDYWGIQCKGKDNYLKSELTEKEINDEITKALSFNPPLKTFVFTTTAPKDVAIEEYVRLKDQESCKNGTFSIVLYSWQDIVDLIEENRETYNWYVNEQQFKTAFDVDVSIKTKIGDLALRPKFLRTIHDYKFSPGLEKTMKVPSMESLADLRSMSLFGSNKTNYSWCELSIIVTNNGSKVIEDWRLWLDFSVGVKRIDDDFTKDPFISTNLLKTRTTWSYKDEKKVLCVPLDNSPLIQKISKGFGCFCIPDFNVNDVTVKWHLLARDFDREGEVTFTIIPQYETARKTHFLDGPENTRTETVITEYIE
jgi:hypothetical protein